MKPYKVVVEAIFVDLPNEDLKGRHGFFATFYVLANGAKNAVHRVSDLLQRQMHANAIQETDSGLFRTRYFVHDLWEVDDATYAENADNDSGFTLFRMNAVAEICALLRVTFLEWCKPHLRMTRP